MPVLKPKNQALSFQTCAESFRREKLNADDWKLSIVQSAGICNQNYRNLRRWIDYNEKLKTALAEQGYVAKQRYLTPAQVALIIHYLGGPMADA